MPQPVGRGPGRPARAAAGSGPRRGSAAGRPDGHGDRAAALGRCPGGRGADARRRARPIRPAEPADRTAPGAPCLPCRRPGARSSRGRRRRHRGRRARPTRMPVAYSSSSAARSRRWTGSSSSAATAATSSSAAAERWASTGGSVRWRLGAVSRREGSVSIRPVRSSQPKKVRSEAERACDRGARGTAARQHSEPGPQVGEGHGAQRRVVVGGPDLVEEDAHVTHVGTHRVRGPATFGAQVAFERGQRVGTDDIHARSVSPHGPQRNDTPRSQPRSCLLVAAASCASGRRPWCTSPSPRVRRGCRRAVAPRTPRGGGDPVDGRGAVHRHGRPDPVGLGVEVVPGLARNRPGPAAGSRSSPIRAASSATSAASVTSTASVSRTSAWQPAEVMLVTGPGTAPTGRWCSRAALAVVRDPDRRLASTTTVALASRAMIRLRARKRER